MSILKGLSLCLTYCIFSARKATGLPMYHLAVTKLGLQENNTFITGPDIYIDRDGNMIPEEERNRKMVFFQGQNFEIDLH